MLDAQDTHASQTITADELATAPLRIERVIPPEPHYGAGTYEVRLELSREMTRFEAHALQVARHGLQPTGRVLTICDTTLERVAEEAAELGALVHHAQEAGRRLEAAVRRREARKAVLEAREATRLAALAETIHFPE